MQVGIAGEREIRRAIDKHYRNREESAPRVHVPHIHRESAIDSDPMEPEANAPRNFGLPAFLRQRLDSLYLNQLKIEKILTSLTELLQEKGVVQR